MNNSLSQQLQMVERQRDDLRRERDSLSRQVNRLQQIIKQVITDLQGEVDK